MRLEFDQRFYFQVNAGRGVDEVYCEMEQIFQELLTKH